MEFTRKLEEVKKEVIDYIRKVVTERGDNPYELIDPSTYDDIDGDVYELPRGVYIDNEDKQLEYPITTISIYHKDNSMWFNGIGKESEDDRLFGESELSIETLCSIGDLIYKLEN